MHENEPSPLADAVLAAARGLVGLAARSVAEVDEDVTLPQFRALVILWQRGVQTPGALGVELGVVASSATRLCDRLEARGLIARRRSDASRREVEVSLTDAGRELVEHVWRRRQEEVARLVAAVPEEQHEVLIAALEALAAAAGESSAPRWDAAWR